MCSISSQERPPILHHASRHADICMLWPAGLGELTVMYHCLMVLEASLQHCTRHSCILHNTWFCATLQSHDLQHFGYWRWHTCAESEQACNNVHAGKEASRQGRRLDPVHRTLLCVLTYAADYLNLVKGRLLGVVNAIVPCSHKGSTHRSWRKQLSKCRWLKREGSLCW